MNTELVEREFREKVSEQVRLLPQGLDRFVVLQPFAFDDGDHFVVIMRREEDHWTITDEGHTLMHVQYDNIDLTSETRAKLLQRTLSAFAVENAGGELRMRVPDGRFGDALYSYLQALGKISDLDFLTRESVRSTFLDDARALMEQIIPQERRVFEYHDPCLDPKGVYRVDCRINGRKRPELVFFIPNDSRCQNATIVCHQFERWKAPFRATGIFEDQAEVNPRAVAQFADIAYKLVPTLASDRIKGYFRELLDEGA
jgi:hypothetical protein